MIPPRARVWCMSLAMSAATVFVAARPQEQRPPIFRGGTTFVSVDAYPRRNGAFVDGLTAADFTVLEDGKPQAIATFELVRFEPNAPDANRIDPGSVADAERQAMDPHTRLFVVYLDVYHTTFDGSRMGSPPLVDFLDRTITRSDLFAVLTPNTPIAALTFGRRTETIRRALSETWDWGERRDTGAFLSEPGEQDIEICKARVLDPRKPAPDPVGLYREDLLMTSLERLTTRLDGLRDERKNILFLSEGWVPQGPVSVNAFYPPPQAPGIGVGRGGTLGRDPTPNILSSAGRVSGDDECRAKIQRLFDMDFAQRFDDLVTAAARANITFYPIDVGGLKVGGVSGMSTLRTLAEANDGVALVANNDIAMAFRRISDRVSAYYLLGYYSSNEARDGKFRKIEVKIGSQTVSARRGYYAYPMSSASAPALTPSPSQPMTDALNRLGRLDSDDEVLGAAIVSSDAVDVVVDLTSREFDTGKWASGAAVAVRLTNPAGDEIRAEDRIAAGRRSVLVHVPTGGRTGPWRGTAEVRGEGRTSEAPVRAEEAEQDTARDVTVYRGTTSSRSPLQPTAEPRFSRNERLHVEVSMDSAAMERSARILDRRGQALPASASVTVQTTADGRTMLAVDVLAGSLASGDYLLEISAGAGAEVRRRFVAFRVVR